MINAAIVGLGRWGQSLVESVKDSSEITFTHGVTRTVSKAAEFCAERNIALTDDYAAMLKDNSVDAVVIASPHTLHLEQTVAAAEAGKHVFCEKPFTLTRADAETGLNALAQKNLVAGIGHNRRYAPNTMRLKQMVASGELGQPIHIEGNFSANMARYEGEWRTDRGESPAGGMTSLGIHAVDAFLHLFGRMAEVDVVSKRIAMPYDVDDATSMLIGFENGCTGYLGTIAATAMLWHVRAFGSEGFGEIRDQNRFDRVMTDGSSDTESWEGYAYPAFESIGDGLNAFAKACAGTEAYPIPPEDILHATSVLEAIIKSGETGTPQKVA